MLIHKYEKQIKQFMTEEKKANNKAQYLSGCYIVSRERHPNEFKLGLSTNLMERIIKQYKICMSKKTKECFIHYAVICPRDYENNKTYSAIMEKLLLAQIANEDKESYSHECFLNDNMDTVGERLIKILKENKKYWMTAIKFEDDGFYIFDKTKWSEKTNFEETPSFDPAVNIALGKHNPVLMDVAKAEQQRLIEQAELLKNNTVLVEENRKFAEQKAKKAEARKIKYAENAERKKIEKEERQKKEILLRKPIVSNIPKKSSTEKSTRLGRTITKPARYRLD